MKATVDYERDGRQLGHIRIPHSVHRSAYGHIPVPIAVLRNGEGPTVLLVGGIHGDEYEGPVSLAKLVQRIDIQRVKGTIIVLPAMNYPAFLGASRVSPIDGINLNRTFPGKADGTVTEVIADYVTRELLPKADYVFDIHAGGSSLNYVPSVISAYPGNDEKGERIKGIIRAMSPEQVLYYDGDKALIGETRIIGNYAQLNGAIYIVGEYGGGSTVNVDGLAMVERCLARFLQHVGALDAQGVQQYLGSDHLGTAQTQSYSMDGEGLFIYATHAGIFEPTFRLGDLVSAGQVAGYIYDAHNPWKAPEEIRFEADGVVMCTRTFAAVEPGDCVAHLVRPL